MILDWRATQTMNAAGESGLVQVMRGGDAYSEQEALGPPSSPASSPLGLCQPCLPRRALGRAQVFHPPGNTTCCHCRIWDASVSSLLEASIPDLQ